MPFTILGLAYCVNVTAVIVQWKLAIIRPGVPYCVSFKSFKKPWMLQLLISSYFKEFDVLSRFLLYFFCNLLLKTVRAAGL